MELVGTVIGFIKCIGVPTCKYLDNHRKLEEKMNDLRMRLNDLNVRKQDIESKNEAEIRCGKMVKKEVEKWLKDVEKMNVEIQEIEQKLLDVSYFSRARLGKLVRKKIEEVKEIYQHGYFSDGVAVDRPPAKGVTFLTSDLEGETDVMKQIWKLLMDDKVGIVGVCGMGGIGKTTIMKHINNQLLKENGFDQVIWVTVSKEMNIFKIQEDIARSLKNYIPEDEVGRATTLKDVLEEKRYVLILDDVWEGFSLLDIGIPDPKLDTGRKVVLTSRSIEVCKSMDCKVVEVQPLSKEESMDLFLNHVGHSVVQDLELKGIVSRIVEKCGGLPLAIVTIACSMKGVDDICEWSNALNELRHRVKSVKGWDDKIFECLMFSYNRLRNSKIQNCFLYCSLYPEDYSIRRNELIEKWIDERLIYEDGYTRQAMYDKGHSILNTLENNCLLERAITLDFEMGVKMHDVLRDMALSIKGDAQLYVKAGIQLKELPDEHEWTGNFDKVSLMHNSILEIPSHISPKCHNLSTLLLQQNEGFGWFLGPGFKMIPETFFEHMKGLKVLDLSYTNISNLPDSISNLENLTALVLRGCYNLRYLPSLAKLRALKKLDLYKTAINEIPPQMEMLENLTYLALQSKGLQELPTGLLPRFPRLQYLATMLHLKGEEVGKLGELEFLSCLFHDMQEFEKCMSTIGKWPPNFFCAVGSSLPRYASLFGVDSFFEKPEKCNDVYFVNCDLKEADFEMLPIDLHCFYIEKCDDLKCLSDISFFLKATNLKNCYIWECQGIECVVDLSLSPCNSFQNIEKLVLGKSCNLLELVRVGATVESSCQTPPAIFSSLKAVYLEKCYRMKKLFSVELLQGLQNLEEMEVEDCEEMEKIIASEEEEEENDHNGTRGSNKTTVVLPKLRELSLYNLPRLKSICGNGVMIPTDCLQYLRITGCPELKRIPLLLPKLENGQPSTPPFLKRIWVKPREWWESTKWDDPNAIDVLSTFVSYQDYYY